MTKKRPRQNPNHRHPLQIENERLQGVVNLAAETIIACERACWHEGQTIPGLNTEIRRIVGKFIKKAKDQGLDFESGAYGSDSEPPPESES